MLDDPEVPDVESGPSETDSAQPAGPPVCDSSGVEDSGPSTPHRRYGAATDPVCLNRKRIKINAKNRRYRRMKRKRHAKVPPFMRPKADPNWRTTTQPMVLKNPEAIESPVIKDLLQDLDKPLAEMSPMFQRLIHPRVGLEPAERRMRDTLIMAVVSLEGGYVSRASNRLKIARSTVQRVVTRNEEHELDTPDIIKDRVEHAKKVERKIQDEVESLANIFIEISRESATKLLKRVRDSKTPIGAGVLANIAKVSAEKALVLSGLGPGRLGVRGAEKALSDTELEEQAKLNAELMSSMGEPDLKVVEGGGD